MSHRRRSAPRPSSRACEALEVRRLLAASLQDGILTVNGTDDNDDLSIAQSGEIISVLLNGAPDGEFDVAQIARIDVFAADGNDSISLAGVMIPASLSGGDGNDTLVGGESSDTLSGGDGNDDFFSADGQSDTLNGGQGSDNAIAADLPLDTFNGVEFGGPGPAPEIAVSLNGDSVADNATSPISFGAVTQGQTGPLLSFAVTNLGTDVLSLGNVSVPAGFVVESGLPPTLNPGESATLRVQILTTVAGTFAGDIQFSNSDPDENPFNFAVTATVNPAPPQLPEIQVSIGAAPVVDGQSTPINFGSVTQGDPPPAITFIVRNTGNAPLNLGAIALPVGYSLAEGLAATLNPGESDEFTIRLDTITRGAKAGQLSFTTNDIDEDPFNFPVFGIVNLPPPNGPQIAVSIARPAGPIDNGNCTVDFGSRSVNGKNPTRTFRVHNTGNQPLSFSDINVPEGFEVIDPLQGPIAAGSAESFVVRMKTAVAGEFNGFVEFTTNDPSAATFRFRIIGSVAIGSTPQPEITVNAQQNGQLRGVSSGSSVFAFADSVVGQKKKRPMRTFRVANVGTADLNLGALQIPAGFVILDGLTPQLKPGASDNFTIAVDTSTAGARSGTVRFGNNDLSENPFTFNVAATVRQPGAGGTPEIAVELGNGIDVADGSAAPISFGTVVQGAAPVVRYFRVTNTAGGNLSLGGIVLPAGFSLVEGLSASLAPGASDLFSVRLDTTTPRTWEGEVRFSTNDPSENPFNFRIAGIVSPAPTGAPAVTASLAGGTLTVNGTRDIDTIAFAAGKSGIVITGNGRTVAGSPFAAVARIAVSGGDGDDRIIVGNAINLPVTISGGGGNDTLVGGNADDLLQGDAGDDNLDGGAGADTLRGGFGNDVLTGGAGLDHLFGEDGNDVLNAADGLSDPTIDGGAGSDIAHKDRTDGATNL